MQKAATRVHYAIDSSKNFHGLSINKYDLDVTSTLSKLLHVDLK